MVLRPERSHPPAGWTDRTDGDPGITMLQLFAFSVTALLAVGAIRRLRKRRCRAG